jgi:outer membrane protein
MRLKPLLIGLAAISTIFPIAASAQTQTQFTAENPWMVRVRAVGLFWQNGQTNTVQALDVKAKNQMIPELDVSYFFTKNIAAELVLTYPQSVQIDAGNNKIGTIKALPPSLLLQYHFTELGAFKPYVGAGVNYTIFSSRNNIAGGAFSVDNSSFGAVGQIGMDYMLDKHWGLNVDLKYATMSTNVTTAAGANAGKLNLNPWMPAVGIAYKF